jgi:hypothetical protein
VTTGHNFSRLAAGQSLGSLAPNHYLASMAMLGLEQDRIHVHAGLNPSRQRLERLRSTDLAARGDSGVVGHILGLEGRHAERVQAA